MNKRSELDYIGVLLGLYLGYIRIILGVLLGLYWGCIQVKLIFFGVSPSVGFCFMASRLHIMVLRRSAKQGF